MLVIGLVTWNVGSPVRSTLKFAVGLMIPSLC